jgi:hypothetical protein
MGMGTTREIPVMQMLKSGRSKGQPTGIGSPPPWHGHGYNKGDTGDTDAEIWKIERPTDGYWVTPS